MYAAATPPTALFTDRNFQCWDDDIDPLYQEDMDDPIPLEDRGDAPVPEIDAERIASRDPETGGSTHRGLAGSFNTWMRQTFMEEEAARKIQLFVRPRLPSHGSADDLDEIEEEHEEEEEDEDVIAANKILAANAVAAMRQTDTTLSFASVDVEDEDDSDDEDAVQYEVFLWHGSYLGLEFYSCNMTGYPCVEDANGNDSLPGMWNVRQGDYLVSINDCSTHEEEMDFDGVVQILDDGVRPAILRFRRPRIQEVRHRTSLARMSSNNRGSFNSAKKEVQRRRERLERSLCYVVWREEDGPLGIVLKPERNKPYPTVSEVSPSGVVARESERNPIRAGDLLLSINHMDVSAMGYRQSLEIMKFAPRPLVLTFRRSSPDYPVARSLEL